MSDSQKAAMSLTLVVESCKAALIALADGSSADEEYLGSDFATLRKDFMSILALLHAASTKVALSLKPSSPQHKASLTPLKDLSNNVAAVVHSIRLMRRTHGETVLSEYEGVARNVVSSIEHFIQFFVESELEGSTSNDYLVGVGKVHELIDSAKKPGGLSLNNREAVRKKWRQDHDSLADAAEEIQDMCKAPSGNEVDEEEFLDDGWDELGLDSKQALSPEERDRTEKMQAVVKLTILLHKRVLSATLSPDAPERDDATLDRLSRLSAKLLPASDDLISSLYAPQQPSIISPYLTTFLDVIKDIQSTLLPPPKDLDQQLDSLSLSKPASDKSSKWFTTCFEQLDKAATKVSETLAEKEAPI